MPPVMEFPLIAPNPPRLSALSEGLRRIEASGVFSNHGPEVRAFEADITARMFGGSGASLAVANATLGLMVAIAALGLGTSVRAMLQVGWRHLAVFGVASAALLAFVAAALALG